jgi:hypothetical protein
MVSRPSRLCVQLAIRTLLFASIANRSKIRSLGLLLKGPLIGGYITAGDLQTSDELALQISKSMKHLEHLHLVVGVENNLVQTQWLPSTLIPREKNPKEEEDEERQWTTTLPHFVGLFPQITWFTLDLSRYTFNLSGYGAWVVTQHPFNCLSKTLYLPNLQVLDIRRTACESHSLLRLLRRHPTLKEIYLEIELGKSTEEWKSLMETIWSNMALHRLVLNNCSTIDGADKIQSMYNACKADENTIDVIITDIFSLDKALEAIASLESSN